MAMTDTSSRECLRIEKQFKARQTNVRKRKEEEETLRQGIEAPSQSLKKRVHTFRMCLQKTKGVHKICSYQKELLQ